MVVKIPIKRGKTTSEKAVLESPGTKTTMVTNENETPCRFGAAAAKQKKRRSHNSISSNANEGDVGDGSSISSRSSMNSASSIDRDVRDGVVINDGKLITDAAAANTAAAAASTTVLSSEDYSSMTICSPSDQSREQIDHPYSSPDTLFIGVSVVFWQKCCSNYQFILSHAIFSFFCSMIGSFTTPKSAHIKVSQFHSTSNSRFPNSINH